MRNGTRTESSMVRSSHKLTVMEHTKYISQRTPKRGLMSLTKTSRNPFQQPDRKPSIIGPSIKARCSLTKGRQRMNKRGYRISKPVSLLSTLSTLCQTTIIFFVVELGQRIKKSIHLISGMSLIKFVCMKRNNLNNT